jgi:protein tyrosine phosphatase (PTP) superfamily phosphohydrolase (DUF442 family)
MTTPIDALQGVVNANQALPNVVTAGQPGPEHFRALRAAGVEVVLDTRAPTEPRGFDEPALMRELGFEYVLIPITDQTLTDETLGRITETMRANADRQVLVHCASGNRIGGALVPYLMLDQGFTEDDATMAALRIGLRAAHLLHWGLDYVRSHREGS